MSFLRVQKCSMQCFKTLSLVFKIELHFRTTTATFCTHCCISIFAFIIIFPAYIYCLQLFHCTCHCFKYLLPRTLPFSIIPFKSFFLSAKLTCLLLRHITFNLIISPSFWSHVSEEWIRLHVKLLFHRAKRNKILSFKI